MKKNNHTKESLGALYLSDGTFAKAKVIGAKATMQGEFVFHTGHTGYQEILTDPSYNQQVIVFSATEIGNQGFDPDDFESQKMFASGLVMRDYREPAFHWRMKESLDEVLKTQKIPGLVGIDTRRLILHLRQKGSLWGVISTETSSKEELQKHLKNQQSMEGLGLADRVSTSKTYIWKEGSHPLIRSFKKQTHGLKKCVVMDFGVKRQILRYLIDSGFEECHVVPSSTTADEILALKPDALFLSNGPGDPAALTNIVSEVKKCLGKLPIFGICLGHQILGLALGVKTYKLKFGHHAANHPVKNWKSGKVEITSQNHGFAVNLRSDHPDIEITHTHMNDETVAGFRHRRWPIQGLQFHPEAGPGPLDSLSIFKQFQQGFKS